MTQRHIAASSINEIGQTIKRAQEKLLAFVQVQPTLTPGQVTEIINLNGSLALARSQLITNSVGISVRGLAAPVAKLKEVTKKTEEIIETLADLQRGLRILATLTSLATGLAMGDVQAITSAGTTLAQEVGISFP